VRDATRGHRNVAFDASTSLLVDGFRVPVDSQLLAVDSQLLAVDSQLLAVDSQLLAVDSQLLAVEDGTLTPAVAMVRVSARASLIGRPSRTVGARRRSVRFLDDRSPPRHGLPMPLTEQRPGARAHPVASVPDLPRP
jgi:hypothetical protein